MALDDDQRKLVDMLSDVARYALEKEGLATKWQVVKLTCHMWVDMVATMGTKDRPVTVDWKGFLARAEL